MTDLPRPTVLGLSVFVACALTIAVAASTDTPELAPLAVVMAIPLVCAPLIAWSGSRRCRDSAVFHAHVEPAEASVGTDVRWMLSVTNRARVGRPLPAIGIRPPAAAWRRSGSGHPAERRRLLAPSARHLVAVTVPGPGLTATVPFAAPTGRRGIFELPAGTTWVHDPFGLFGARGPTTPAAEMAVHPVPAEPAWRVEGSGLVGVGPGVVGGQSTGSGMADFEGLRPYVVGDRLSQLHWPSKARYGTWFVKQFEAEAARDVPVILDDRAGVHRRPAFEELVAAALWLVGDTLDSGTPVHLFLMSGTDLVFEPSPTGRARAGRLFAGVVPTRDGSSQPARRWPSGTILLTTATGADRLPRWFGPPPDQPPAGADSHVVQVRAG